MRTATSHHTPVPTVPRSKPSDFDAYTALAVGAVHPGRGFQPPLCHPTPSHRRDVEAALTFSQFACLLSCPSRQDFGEDAFSLRPRLPHGWAGGATCPGRPRTSLAVCWGTNKVAVSKGGSHRMTLRQPSTGVLVADYHALTCCSWGLSCRRSPRLLRHFCCGFGRVRLL